MQKTIELKVDGMDCTGCAKNITVFLEKKGLQDVYVNFSTGEVRYVTGSDSNNLQLIKDGIKKLGYSIVGEDKEPFWTLEKRLTVASIFTLPLFLSHFFMMAGVPFLENPWMQFALCLPVYLIGFFYFGGTSIAALKNGTAHMDLLIFIGSTAAFIYSVIGTIQNNHDYIFYETSATIITLVLLGNLMEKRAVKQTTTAISELTDLQVQHAKKIMPSGTVVSVEIEEILPGDWLQVNEGDKIPVDATVIKGSAEVDESMLTGESIPVDKIINDKVIGGSLITSGNLTIAANSTSKETVLSNMIELVKSAQEDKPNIQRLADKISGIFVPVVLGISILTFLFAFFVFQIPLKNAVMNSIAVLVISCPCAMGLATPTAVMVGVGRLAKNGILVKGGATVEVFSKLKNFVFDKTGTLTTGDFKIKNIHYTNEKDANEINAILLKIEQRSSHPIAESLVKELSNKKNLPKIKLFKTKEIKGHGMTAEDNEERVYKLGSKRFAAPFIKNGNAPLYLSRNNELLATIEIEDDIKSETAEVINYLKKENKTPIILSGDQKEKTSGVAKELNVKNYYAEKTPAEKLTIIEKLNNEAPTAMIGDGINDAPALAKATIGISLSDASGAAMQSAQVILLNGNLSRLKKALSISKATLKTIKQNLFWAFAYNIIAIPVAALGYLHPMWGVLFMALSDVVVIGNSIRLKFKEIE